MELFLICQVKLKFRGGAGSRDNNFLREEFLVLKQMGNLFWLASVFLLGLLFFAQKKLTVHLDIRFSKTTKLYSSPKSTMSSHVVTIAEGVKEKRRIKTKIGVGFIVK